MHQKVAESRQRNANLQAELEHVQDPYYLALLARDGIGLVQEGDLPVVVYEGPPEAAHVAPPNQQTPTLTPDKPPWQEWLELMLP